VPKYNRASTRACTYRSMIFECESWLHEPNYCWQ